MRYELPKVLSPLLHPEQHDYRLLRPIGRLEQVVELEASVERQMRGSLIHSTGIEVPDWRSAHHIEPCRPHYAKVEGGIGLFHESESLTPRFQAAEDSQGP